MTTQVAYKVLSEFWCWYGDVVKTVSRITSNKHELAALDEVGEHTFDGLPLPSLDAKFYICGKEFEVRDAFAQFQSVLLNESYIRVFPECLRYDH